MALVKSRQGLRACDCLAVTSWYIARAWLVQVLGPTKPLTGWAMEDLAGAYQRPEPLTALEEEDSWLIPLRPQNGT